MTEWEKKEEQHCQALEEAEDIFRLLVGSLCVDESGGTWVEGEDEAYDAWEAAKAWLKKYCEED